MTALIEGLCLVERCRRICEASGAPYLIENPVSTLATYWRKPDYTFHPCDLAGIWMNPVMRTPKRPAYGWETVLSCPNHDPFRRLRESKMHLMPPSVNRANLRSATPKGFAKAVFEVNGNSNSKWQR